MDKIERVRILWHDRKFWYEKYKDKDQIKEWYKNWKSFGGGSKEEFLQGEKEQIDMIFLKEGIRQEVFSFMQKVVVELE